MNISSANNTDKRTVEFLGSVSYGTMRSEDLIPALYEVLARYWPSRAKERREEYPEIFEREMSGSYVYYPDTQALKDIDYDEDLREPAQWLVEHLFEDLNEIAPEGFHFSSSEGDGADYGFWANDDADEVGNPWIYDPSIEYIRMEGGFVECLDEIRQGPYTITRAIYNHPVDLNMQKKTGEKYVVVYVCAKGALQSVAVATYPYDEAKPDPDELTF